MMRMNKFRLVNIKKPVPPALGTAFAGAGDKKGGNKKKTAGRLSAEEWYALRDANKAKLRKERENAKVDKPTDKKPSKSKDSDDKSTLGDSVTSLKKELLALKKFTRASRKPPIP